MSVTAKAVSRKCNFPIQRLVKFIAVFQQFLSFCFKMRASLHEVLIFDQVCYRKKRTSKNETASMHLGQQKCVTCDTKTLPRKITRSVAYYFKMLET